MLKSDLKQIKQIIKDELIENNKNLVTKSEFVNSNKNIFRKIKELGEEIAINTSQSINELRCEMNERFDEVNIELKKKISKQDLIDWDFGMGISSDIDKLKYLHIDELKSLPNRAKIKTKLVANNL
ncbi:MAG: hypothetical protein PHZ07_02545 [Patescibacteria group bacterium]|nr:hypothetical protein [Patescibacteria group bacterium]MDD4304278.1 hypothetical protein [Patescibacteria group bacterium]MDD4695332.1 hypothetical protein [Patescibacteria group bacterium]